MAFLSAELALGVAGIALLALAWPSEDGGDEARSVIIATAGATLLLLALFRTIFPSKSKNKDSAAAPNTTAAAGAAATAATATAAAAGASGGSKLKDIEDLAAPRDNLHTDAAAEKRRLKRDKLRLKKSLIPLTLQQMKDKAIVRSWPRRWWGWSCLGYRVMGGWLCPHVCIEQRAALLGW